MRRRFDWQDGLLLKADHLSAEQNYLEQEQANLLQFLCGEREYGLAELAWDQVSLAQGHLMLNRCLAIMPSGELVDYQAGRDLPVMMKLERDLENQLIHLGLPGYGEDGRYKPVVNAAHSQAIELSPVLSLSPLGRCSIPIAKVSHCNERGVQFDTHYEPSAICIGVLPALMRQLSIFVNELEALHARLFELVHRASHRISLGLKQSMALTIVGSTLLSLKRCQHPRTKLRELECHLMLYQRQLCDVVGAHCLLHEGCLNELIVRLTQLQKELINVEAKQVPVKPLDDVYAVAMISEFVDATRWFISIKPELPCDELDLLMASLKVAAKSNIQNLIKHQLPGLVIKRLDCPPEQLLFNNSSAFFEIECSGKLWEVLRGSGVMVFHWPDGLKAEEWALWVSG